MSNLTLFEQLFTRNVNDRVEKKTAGKATLSYLSWAWAWAEIKKVDPKASSVIHEFPLEGNEHIMVPYLKTPNGYFVKVSVTIQDHTETEWLPVMDANNNALGSVAQVWSKEKNAQGKSFKVEERLPEPTAMEINKAHKRCLVKAIALHGLGLYIFSGEDLPETIEPDATKELTEQLHAMLEEFASLRGVPKEKALEAVNWDGESVLKESFALDMKKAVDNWIQAVKKKQAAEANKEESA